MNKNTKQNKNTKKVGRFSFFPLCLRHCINFIDLICVPSTVIKLIGLLSGRVEIVYIIHSKALHEERLCLCLKGQTWAEIALLPLWHTATVCIPLAYLLLCSAVHLALKGTRLCIFSPTKRRMWTGRLNIHRVSVEV